MGNNTNTKYFVNHPRYGDQPTPSIYKFSKEEIEKAHWRYMTVKYFEETAIPADVNKQEFAIYPRSIYVDIEEHCVACKRAFIFFAQEQKYWFEELGFWVDAHCIRCTYCRKKDREIKNMQVTYQKLVTKKDRTKKQTNELKNIALELFQLGFIKDRDKINRIS